MGAWLEATNLPTYEGAYVTDTIARLMDSIDIANVKVAFDRI
jgi:hypothetical protein